MIKERSRWLSLKIHIPQIPFLSKPFPHSRCAHPVSPILVLPISQPAIRGTKPSKTSLLLPSMILSTLCLSILYRHPILSLPHLHIDLVSLLVSQFPYYLARRHHLISLAQSRFSPPSENTSLSLSKLTRYLPTSQTNFTSSATFEAILSQVYQPSRPTLRHSHQPGDTLPSDATLSTKSTPPNSSGQQNAD